MTVYNLMTRTFLALPLCTSSVCCFFEINLHVWNNSAHVCTFYKAMAPLNQILEKTCNMCNTSGSVLTRILPWGVPGPPLLRNRGPVRTLGGQSYSRWSVTWWAMCIRFNIDANNLHHVRGNNIINSNNIED